MKIRIGFVFVLLAILMAACITVQAPPETVDNIAKPNVVQGEPANSVDQPNSCFHMTLNEATKQAGGNWDIEPSGSGYHGAHQMNFSTGSMFSFYAEGGPNTRVDTIAFLWNLSIDTEGGGGQTYDFLTRCNLNPMPILDAMESCSEAEEKTADGCTRSLSGGLEMGSKLDNDGTYVVIIMDW